MGDQHEPRESERVEQSLPRNVKHSRRERSGRLKAAYITSQFPEPSETFATNEVRMLSRCGVSISVHALRPPHRDANRLARERAVGNIRVTYNGVSPSLQGVVAALRRPVLFLRALAWIVRRNRHRLRDLVVSVLLLPRAFNILADIEDSLPDVVHMYWGHYPTIAGYLVQQRLPRVVTSLSIVAYDLNREYGGAIDVARNADVIRTHARANVGHISRFAGVAHDRINVIYNGVDIAWLNEVTQGIEKVRFRLVATGRLIPDKGMDDVLNAFATIRSTWPDASLVIAGDGPDRQRLEALSGRLQVDHAVDFLGHVPHARVVQEMAKAEVFLLLSRYAGERLPNVVKEAMACRCVCVTTPTPGIEELIEDGIHGFVVPMASPDAAVEAVSANFSGQVDVHSITSAAVEHVHRSFDLGRTAPQYQALWTAALGARARPYGHARGVVVQPDGLSDSPP